MSANACQLCGKPLSRIRLLREGNFCCREHREEYRLRRGLSRLLEASEVSQLERRKEHPELLPLWRPASEAGNGAPRLWPDTPSLGRAAHECFAPALCVAAALRPTPAGYARAAGYGAEPAANVAPRRDLHPARMSLRLALGTRAAAVPPVAEAASFGLAPWRLPLNPGAAGRRRQASDGPRLGQARLRPGAVRLALRSGRRRPAPGAAGSGWLAASHVPQPDGPRSVPAARFRSADPHRAAPIPAGRRRPGCPVGAPAGGLRRLHSPLALDARARRRALAQPFGTARIAPTLPASWARLAVRKGTAPAVFGAPAEPLTKARSTAACRPRRRAAAQPFSRHRAQPGPSARAVFAPAGLDSAAPTPLRHGFEPVAIASVARAAREPLGLHAPTWPEMDLPPVGAVGGTLADSTGAGAAPVEDNFGSGLGRWVGGIEDWRLDVAGARTGPPALFIPSLGMRDYEREFLAKMERRSVAWFIRAADFENYYRVRISRSEQDPNALELTRYAVLGGVAEEPVTVPLRVAVRSKAAFRVLTTAAADSFTVAVEGEVVDRWSDGRLGTGGIGFEAEQDDRARLYWVKLTPRGRQSQPAASRGIAPRRKQRR